MIAGTYECVRVKEEEQGRERERGERARDSEEKRNRIGLAELLSICTLGFNAKSCSLVAAQGASKLIKIAYLSTNSNQLSLNHCWGYS